MKRFKLSTEVLFSEDAIDALLEEKDENAVLITDKFGRFRYGRHNLKEAV